MKTTVRWQDGVAFEAETGSGHRVMMDGAPDVGGRNLGGRPIEMLLVGLGGCTAFDVVHILKRGRHDVTGCTVDVEAERAENVPKVFTKISLHFVVTGRKLAPDAVARAVELSRDKYCSASIMFAQVAKMEHSWDVVEG
jgi:putative redox protein